MNAIFIYVRAWKKAKLCIGIMEIRPHLPFIIFKIIHIKMYIPYKMFPLCQFLRQVKVLCLIYT